MRVILDSWRCVALWPNAMDKWYFLGPIHVTAEDAAEEARGLLLDLGCNASEITSLLADLESGHVLTLEMGISLRVLEPFPGFRKADIPEGIDAGHLRRAWDAWREVGTYKGRPLRINS